MNLHRILPVLATMLLLASCHSKPPATSSEGPTHSVSRSPMLPAGSENLPPPTAADLRAISQKVFGARAKAQPVVGSALTGDFNGDGYEDIALHLQANAAIIQQDETGLANWITEDPAQVYLPPLNKNVQRLPAKTAPVRLRKGEDLLLILHGYGPQGWRSPQARQAYLLVNSGTENSTVAVQSLPALANDPRFPHTRRQVLCGSAQCIFWNGAYYELYDRKSGTIFSSNSK